ncbi:unnamed protein product [Moneuplotes crassus]|uniref:Uncharacterized protein n=1 Tax=Euplotes crassus TaxID=5936 RepID=A0AAD1XMA4_EUPCR|nr:unnamed protein product [Moneuplotes crassus]
MKKGTLSQGGRSFTRKIELEDAIIRLIEKPAQKPLCKDKGSISVFLYNFKRRKDSKREFFEICRFRTYCSIIKRIENMKYICGYTDDQCQDSRNQGI